jgi:hypothetical protein
LQKKVESLGADALIVANKWRVGIEETCR